MQSVCNRWLPGSVWSSGRHHAHDYEQPWSQRGSVSSGACYLRRQRTGLQQLGTGPYCSQSLDSLIHAGASILP